MLRSLVVVPIAAVALVACEHEYVYEPAVSTSAAVAGRPASYYAIPAEAPRGDVRVATLGFVDIHPESGGESTRGVHIRIVVANNSDKAWTLDTREQILSLPRRGESRPAFASVDRGTPPVVDIPPGEKRTVDLFYPLPADLQKTDALPSFDTIWKVHTDARLVTGRTPFERIEIVPSNAYDGYDYGWGPSYWYDPYYAGGAFLGVDLSPMYAHRPVVIRPHVIHAPPARRR